jgi:hypothetical protein
MPLFDGCLLASYRVLYYRNRCGGFRGVGGKVDRELGQREK